MNNSLTRASEMIQRIMGVSDEDLSAYDEYDMETPHTRPGNSVTNMSDARVQETNDYNSPSNGNQTIVINNYNVNVTNITINNGIPDHNFMKGMSAADQYWIDRDKAYREATHRFYKANF